MDVFLNSKNAGNQTASILNNNVITMPGKGNPDKIKGKGFDKNPQNINRNGAPKKVLKTLMESLREKYGEPIGKAESHELMVYIETLPVQKLAEFVKDQELPAAVQAYARLLLTGDAKDIRRVSAAEMIKDRVHGKPIQAVKHTGEMEITQLTSDEREKRIKELKRKLNAK